MKTNRRSFFQTLGAGAGGLGLTSMPFISSASNGPKADNDDPQLFIGDNIALADTLFLVCQHRFDVNPYRGRQTSARAVR